MIHSLRPNFFRSSGQRNQIIIALIMTKEKTFKIVLITVAADFVGALSVAADLFNMPHRGVQIIRK